jgi:hypothetical protein
MYCKENTEALLATINETGLEPCVATGQTIIVGWFAGCSGRITISGIANRLHYCVTFIVYS